MIVFRRGQLHGEAPGAGTFLLPGRECTGGFPCSQMELFHLKEPEAILGIRLKKEAPERLGAGITHRRCLRLPGDRALMRENGVEGGWAGGALMGDWSGKSPQWAGAQKRVQGGGAAGAWGAANRITQADAFCVDLGASQEEWGMGSVWETLGLVTPSGLFSKWLSKPSMNPRGGQAPWKEAVGDGGLQDTTASPSIAVCS